MLSSGTQSLSPSGVSLLLKLGEGDTLHFYARVAVYIRDAYYVSVGEAARTVADTINALYREKGAERRVEVRQLKDGTPYIRLTNVDLELLG